LGCTKKEEMGSDFEKFTIWEEETANKLTGD
jgi:hypothetical protein